MEEELPKIHHLYPQIELWQAAIMPDHLHLLLYVAEALPDGKRLGDILRSFKGGCSRAWWALGGGRTALESAGTTGTTGTTSTTGTTGTTSTTSTTGTKSTVVGTVKDRKQQSPCFLARFPVPLSLSAAITTASLSGQAC